MVGKHLDDKQREIILKMDYWMRMAYEREKIGLPWQGLDENGKILSNRNKLMAEIADISPATLYRMRSDTPMV